MNHPTLTNTLKNKLKAFCESRQEVSISLIDIQIEERGDTKLLIFPFIPKNVTPRHQQQIKGNLQKKVQKRNSLHSSQILFHTHTSKEYSKKWPKIFFCIFVQISFCTKTINLRKKTIFLPKQIKLLNNAQSLIFNCTWKKINSLNFSVELTIA